MKASSESGLWATEISRTSAETVEEDMLIVSCRFIFYWVMRRFDSVCKFLILPGWPEDLFSVLHRFALRLALRLDFPQSLFECLVRIAQMPAQTPPNRSHSYQHSYCGKHQQHKENLHQHLASIPNLNAGKWKIYTAT